MSFGKKSWSSKKKSLVHTLFFAKNLYSNYGEIKK